MGKREDEGQHECGRHSQISGQICLMNQRPRIQDLSFLFSDCGIQLSGPLHDLTQTAPGTGQLLKPQTKEAK